MTNLAGQHRRGQTLLFQRPECVVAQTHVGCQICSQGNRVHSVSSVLQQLMAVAAAADDAKQSGEYLLALGRGHPSWKKPEGK